MLRKIINDKQLKIKVNASKKMKLKHEAYWLDYEMQKYCETPLEKRKRREKIIHRINGHYANLQKINEGSI